MIMDSNYNSGYNKGSYNSHYQKDNELVVYSTERERAVFYRKTYTHVALAILAFILVETALLHLVDHLPSTDLYGVGLRRYRGALASSNYHPIAFRGAYCGSFHDTFGLFFP